MTDLEYLSRQHREEDGRCAMCKEVWPCTVIHVVQQLADLRDEMAEADVLDEQQEVYHARELAELRENRELLAVANEGNTALIADLLQQLAKTDAALGVLGAALLDLVLAVENAVEADPLFLEELPESGAEIERARMALAPDAVQQAIEAWKAKDAEVERLQQEMSEVRATYTVIADRADVAEAKLAEAMGLLGRVLKNGMGEEVAGRIADFLADPSQAAAQYHEEQP